MKIIVYRKKKVGSNDDGAEKTAEKRRRGFSKQFHRQLRSIGDYDAVFDEVRRKCRAAGKLLGAYMESDQDLWQKQALQYVCCVNDTSILFKRSQEMKEDALRRLSL